MAFLGIDIHVHLCPPWLVTFLGIDMSILACDFSRNKYVHHGL